jgi:hypothetical protein
LSQELIDDRANHLFHETASPQPTHYPRKIHSPWLEEAVDKKQQNTAE